MTTGQARAEQARVVELLEEASRASASGERDRSPRFINAAHQYATGVRGYLIRAEQAEFAQHTIGGQ